MKEILREIFTAVGVPCAIMLFTSYVDKTPIEKYDLKSGVNITLFEDAQNIQNDSLSKEEQKTIDKISNEGCSGININQQYYQDILSSSEIDSTSKFSDSHLEQILNYAQSKGLSAAIRPLLETRDEAPRNQIMPADVDGWFQDYSRILTKLCKIESSEKFDIYLGSELDELLVAHPEKFNELAQNIRNSGFKGRIIHSIIFNCNSDTSKILLLNKIPVDVIGIDFYVRMQNTELPDSMKFYETKYYLNEIFSKSEKPVLITELGYRSVRDNNGSMIFDYRFEGYVDYDMQKKHYDNFIKALTSKEFINDKNLGVYFWITDYPSYVTDINLSKYHRQTGYSYFNKPAEEIVKKYNEDRIFIKYPKGNIKQ